MDILLWLRNDKTQAMQTARLLGDGAVNASSGADGSLHSVCHGEAEVPGCFEDVSAGSIALPGKYVSSSTISPWSSWLSALRLGLHQGKSLRFLVK